MVWAWLLRSENKRKKDEIRKMKKKKRKWLDGLGLAKIMHIQKFIIIITTTIGK